jgi:O-antigen/teichoic acid export membrane protein
MAQPLTSALALTPRSRLPGWLATAWRYGLSTSGPVATSGAHFLASLLLVRNLPAFQFGLFSFVLVIVPFCMSIVAALLVLPVNSALGDAPEARAHVEATCLKMIPALTALAGIIVFGFLALARAPVTPALLLAGFGAVLTYRWFARCLAFVKGSASTAIASDLVYAGALMTGLGALMVRRHVEFVPAAGLLLAAALIGLLPFGTRFFHDQIAAITRARIPDYRTIFRDLTRWSLLGVILTEFTVNAHAYLVTFISGPGPFALLAVGQILLRPASLVQSALPDLERPGMTRAMAAKDSTRLARMLRDFRLVLIAAWLGSVMLAAAILIWAPHLLLKKGYALHDVLPVTLITAAIMLVWSFRTPPATFMQAAGAFKALVGIGLYSSVISIALTLAFLLTLGPIASLCGILAGEIIILFKLTRMVTEWKARHG